MFLAANWLQQGAQRSGVQIQGGLALAENCSCLLLASCGNKVGSSCSRTKFKSRGDKWAQHTLSVTTLAKNAYGVDGWSCLLSTLQERSGRSCTLFIALSRELQRTVFVPQYLQKYPTFFVVYRCRLISFSC